MTDPGQAGVVRAADPRSALIGVRQLDKRYPGRNGGVRALADVSFDVANGEFVSIVGPSGCGKSTLLKILAGLIPRTAGTVRIGERQVARPDRDTGMVFQAPVLLPWRTVLDNVLLPIEISRLPRRRFLDRAMSLLQLLEVIFGILLAWVGANEVPAPSVLLGGTLVIGALVANEWLGWKQKTL